MKISQKRLRQIILEEIQGLFEWPNFKGGGTPPLMDDHGEGEEEFESGVEAGGDLYSMVKDKLEQLLGDMDATVEGGDDHPGQGCEEAHPGQPHEAYIAGQC